MKVVKRINNNVVECIDSSGQEIIAFGKGIGFHEIPYELTDMSLVQRTYYGIHKNYYQLVNEIPEEVFEVSSRIVDSARNKLDCTFNPNIFFTLADHINYSIIRIQKGMYINYSIKYDIKHFYPKEYEVASSAVRLINKVLKTELPDEEITGIAMHILTNKIDTGNYDEKVFERLAAEIVKIVENSFEIKIDTSSFNYSRFMTHLRYLLQRRSSGEIKIGGNEKIFESLINEYPETYECVERIKKYLSQTLNFILDDDESLYLMLHVNRLCASEGCY
ncbi:MAG: PRD domain-containing protein [Erysipelotrichaceae bacterium]|nr:PRD domain-containing protein [Erysipelotrichaceae bacterium]